MITRDAPELSLSRQCRLLSIGRSAAFYYACTRGASPSSLALQMRRIDELFMKYPLATAAARWSASCGGTAFASAVTGELRSR